MCGTDCLLMLLSVLFAPIGVWVKRGICSADSLINIALCCLGVLPGVLHAWYIILKYPDAYEYEGVRDGERNGDGSLTYYYVARGPTSSQSGGQQGYGTVNNQPSSGQFPGQQSGTMNSFQQPKTGSKPQGQTAQPQHGVAGQELGGQGSSGQPAGPPPAYADVVKGDNKVQKP
ncbi:hypothetical protein BDV95DRAFT_666782 [Massariosphaeria phaeospora]|uniref:Stress response RCI peptide n=1 Tax=Massariosphaeria phaeospora TaxID=100035 RepID=A0A7C8ICL1_9PLEO|nr:hypothetical protein BDV95DRAFT_666782 [Massariosphaeria phaeospora]